MGNDVSWERIALRLREVSEDCAGVLAGAEEKAAYREPVGERNAAGRSVNKDTGEDHSDTAGAMSNRAGCESTLMFSRRRSKVIQDETISKEEQQFLATAATIKKARHRAVTQYQINQYPRTGQQLRFIQRVMVH